MAKYDSTKLRNFADPGYRGMAGGGQCGGHVRTDVRTDDVGEDKIGTVAGRVGEGNIWTLKTGGGGTGGRSPSRTPPICPIRVDMDPPSFVQNPKEYEMTKLAIRIVWNS